MFPSRCKFEKLTVFHGFAELPLIRTLTRRGRLVVGPIVVNRIISCIRVAYRDFVVAREAATCGQIRKWLRALDHSVPGGHYRAHCYFMSYVVLCCRCCILKAIVTIDGPVLPPGTRSVPLATGVGCTATIPGVADVSCMRRALLCPGMRSLQIGVNAFSQLEVGCGVAPSKVYP